MAEQVLPEGDLNHRVASVLTKQPTERIEKTTVPPAPIRVIDPVAFRQYRFDLDAEMSKYGMSYGC